MASINTANGVINYLNSQMEAQFSHLQSEAQAILESRDFGDVDAAIYKPFDCWAVRASSMSLFPIRTIIGMATIAAMRGSKKAYSEEAISKIDFKYFQEGGIESHCTLAEMKTKGFLKDEKRSNSINLAPTDLTLQRIAHAWPQFAAMGLYIIWQRGELQPRITGSTVPAWLQFPAAASLPLTDTGVTQMRSFCEEFSKVLKSKDKDGTDSAGVFSENIFLQQRSNLIRDATTNALAALAPQHILISNESEIRANLMQGVDRGKTTGADGKPLNE